MLTTGAGPSPLRAFMSGPAEAAEAPARSTNHGEARSTAWLRGQPAEGGSDCGRAV